MIGTTGHTSGIVTVDGTENGRKACQLKMKQNRAKYGTKVRENMTIFRVCKTTLRCHIFPCAFNLNILSKALRWVI